jgi:cobalt/nickel transport system permease protein
MSLGAQQLDLGTLDALASGDSPVHRLDARTKVLAAAAFVLTVVSFPKYEIGRLIPCFLLPVLAVSASGVPVGPLLKRLLVASVFAVLVGIFNPLMDTAVMYRVGRVPISAGWVSFVSILLKYGLTMSALLILVATTSFPGVARALGRFGVPDVFVCQLVFLYRFLFVLVAEGRRMALARDLRSFEGRGRSLRVTSALLGTLFVRTVERAERVYRAMRSRDFRGALPFAKPERLRGADLACLALTGALLVLFRTLDVVGLIGLRLQALF